MVTRWLSGLQKLLNSRWHLNIAQLGCFALAGIFAFLLRFEFKVPEHYVPYLWSALLIWVPVKALVFYLFKLTRGWWRYVSIHDLMRLGIANVVGTMISGAVILAVGMTDFPRSLYALDGILCFGLTAGLRTMIRAAYDINRQRSAATNRRRALIYGAGDAGVALVREIQQNPKLPYQPIGFVDDDMSKSGVEIMRVRVLGNGGDLPSIVTRFDIDVVLIALPSAQGPQIGRVLQLCAAAGVDHKTIPSLAEVIEGSSISSQIRDVAVEDLLAREPVRLNSETIEHHYRGKVVLITGAAGSIGSELCRQLARFQPAAIVGYDVAETPLFFLEGEMRKKFSGVPFSAELGCVQNRTRLEEVLQRYAPAVVFHAAAYKHVPMMERHLFEAIQNNVFGTYNVAQAAATSGVEDFVLVSTDKAVRPTSLMGASKRIAELIVTSLNNQDGPQATEPAEFFGPYAEIANGAPPSRALSGSARSRVEGGRPDGTKFVCVRFGNVLGSNGSVIPLFKAQIAAGGPVTVTHANMRRYFMTIPEAAQLVVQASTMGAGGEVFVLDMGQPVKIVDLARNLILLSGFRPNEDIKISYTGIRAGEKLFEEINCIDEEHVPTSHEKIRIFAGNGMPARSVAAYLSELKEICSTRDIAALLLVLKELVPDYSPSTEFLKRTMSALTGGDVPARLGSQGCLTR